jgi:hypothetical protein
VGKSEQLNLDAETAPTTGSFLGRAVNWMNNSSIGRAIQGLGATVMLIIDLAWVGLLAAAAAGIRTAGYAQILNGVVLSPGAMFAGLAISGLLITLAFKGVQDVGNDFKQMSCHFGAMTNLALQGKFC